MINLEKTGNKGKVLNIFVCITVLFLGLIITYLSLKGIENKDTHLSNASPLQSMMSQKLTPEIKHIDAIIDTKSNGGRKFRTIDLKLEENVESTFFFDKNIGWIGSHEKLLKTEDAGKSWTSVQFPHADGAIVKRIKFVNSATGLIITENNSRCGIPPGCRTQVLITEDSGQRWKLLYQKENIKVRDFYFNEKEIFLVGTSFINHFDRTPLLLCVRLDGTWSDFSEDFFRTFKDNRVSEENKKSEEITGIITKTSQVFRVVTSEGVIYKADQGLQDWVVETRGLNNNPVVSLCACKSGQYDNGDLWLAGGRGGDEGNFSFFAVEEKDTWINYDMTGFTLRDIKIFSNNIIFVSGTLAITSKLEGAILYSENKGRNWSIIYSDKNSLLIDSIFIENNTIFAINEEGNLTKIIFRSL